MLRFPDGELMNQPEKVPFGVPPLAGTGPLIRPEIVSPLGPPPSASTTEIQAVAGLFEKVVNPIADAQKHVADQRLEEIRLESSAWQRVWFALMGLLAFIAFGAVIVAFKGEPNSAREILIALIALLGGIGLGRASKK